jgi:hypothetical protein
MDKAKLAPSIVIAIGMVLSSLIISISMGKLGDDIVAAGIHSRQISLRHANNGAPIRISLDDDSVVQIKTEPSAED